MDAVSSAGILWVREIIRRYTKWKEEGEGGGGGGGGGGGEGRVGWGGGGGGGGGGGSDRRCYMYRLHHDVGVGMGFTKPRAESLRIVSLTNLTRSDATDLYVPWLLAIGVEEKLILIGRFTYSPPRRWV